MSNKITLKEFFDSEERLAIHCHTEEKANKLLKEFDKLGKVWRDGDKYIEKNDYMINNNSTCYNNEGEFSNLGYYLNRNYKIYEFDDIIFEEQPKNLIPFIAEKLGVEIGELFTIRQTGKQYVFDDEDGLLEEVSKQDKLIALQLGECIIQKLPEKPRLNEREYIILSSLEIEYEWLVKHPTTSIVWACENRETFKEDGLEKEYKKLALNIFTPLFWDIEFNSGNYLKIKDLLEEYENYNK